MRLVRALLFVTLTGSLAFADEAPAPATDAKPAETTESAPAPSKPAKAGKVPLRVVKMLPETHQVLLYDKNRGTHVVAEAGQDIDGYIVDDIDDDEVTLVAPSGAEIILTAPDMTWRRRAAERKAAAAHATTPAAPAPTTDLAAAPVDPYADAPAASPGSAPVGDAGAAPADPYADPAAAPATSDGAVRVASAGASTAPAAITPGPATAAAPATSPAPATAPAATTTAPAAVTTAPAAIPGSASAASTPSTAPAPAAAPAAPSPSAQPGAAELAAALAGDPAPVAAPAPAAPPTFTLSRSEVDAALGDFGATAVTFDAKFTSEGLHLDAIAAGTLLAKAGLQKGDTITAVDGKPLRSFDDAAGLYARMGHASRATVQVLRAGKPLMLRVAIR